MSAISTFTPTTTPNATNQLPSSSSNQQLTSSDFINFLITELQNQDPLNPTSSDQMLQQMSEIGQLQSSTTMVSSLQGMVQQNQVAAASALIGKQVQGTDASQNAVGGLVTAVQVNTNGSGVNLTLDSGATVPMNNVTSITGATTNSNSSGSSSSGS